MLINFYQIASFFYYFYFPTQKLHIKPCTTDLLSYLKDYIFTLQTIFFYFLAFEPFIWIRVTFIYDWLWFISLEYLQNIFDIVCVVLWKVILHCICLYISYCFTCMNYYILFSGSGTISCDYKLPLSTCYLIKSPSVPTMKIPTLCPQKLFYPPFFTKIFKSNLLHGQTTTEKLLLVLNVILVFHSVLAFDISQAKQALDSTTK